MDFEKMGLSEYFQPQLSYLVIFNFVSLAQHYTLTIFPNPRGTSPFEFLLSPIARSWALPDPAHHPLRK